MRFQVTTIPTFHSRNLPVGLHTLLGEWTADSVTKTLIRNGGWEEEQPGVTVHELYAYLKDEWTAAAKTKAFQAPLRAIDERIYQ